MLNTAIVLSSAGSLSVAVIALFFFVFQGWIYLKGSLFVWSKWCALLSLTTLFYALTVFIQLNEPPNSINYICELLQYSTFLLLVHCLYGFTFSYLEINPRRYHQIAGTFHLILWAVLWSTDLVITNENLEYRVKNRTGELEKSNAELVAEIKQRKWPMMPCGKASSDFAQFFTPARMP